MQDGPVKSAMCGKLRVNVQRIGVPRYAVQRCLVWAGRLLHNLFKSFIS